jgi:hypothetical protein
VPFDVVFGLDEAERIAYLVIFASFDGLIFDWKIMGWNNGD